MFKLIDKKIIIILRLTILLVFSLIKQLRLWLVQSFAQFSLQTKTVTEAFSPTAKLFINV